MEFKEVIGRRRSIRFFDPDRPVEREKIQKMLEAARLASCAVNAQWARAVVGFRDDLTEDQLKRLKTPVAGLNVELAPVHIHFFNDLGVVQRNEGRPLKELVDVGALAPTHGWSHKFVDDFVYPQILKPMTEGPTATPSHRRSTSASPSARRCSPASTRVSASVSSRSCRTCSRKSSRYPDDWIPLPTLLVGYPAESWDGGGQRPRPPFEEMYSRRQVRPALQARREGRRGAQGGEDDQPPATPNNPDRIAEIKKLAEKYGLPM